MQLVNIYYKVCPAKRDMIFLFWLDTSSVVLTLHASTYRLCQSMIATQYIQYTTFDRKLPGMFRFKRIIERIKRCDTINIMRTKFGFEISKSTKKCPVCDVHLFTFLHKEIAIDACKKCEGIWFKSGELQKIVNKKVISPLKFRVNSSRGEIKICHTCGHDNNTQKTHCEKCSAPLKNLTCLDCTSLMCEYTHKNVLIDFCQICGAYWLDKGELKKVIEAKPDFDRLDIYERDISTQGYTNIDISDIFIANIVSWGIYRGISILL